MRQRAQRRLTDRATIKRHYGEDGEADETNEIGEPVGGSNDDTVTETVAEDVPCAFSGESTSFVREDGGERVQRPATARFLPDADLHEGDVLTFDRHDDAREYEVRGVDNSHDTLRATARWQTAELERAD